MRTLTRSPLSILAALCTTAASAHAQFLPTSRGGLAQVGVTHGATHATNPSGLTHWEWSDSVSYDGTGLPLPCGTGDAGVNVNTTSTNVGLTIFMSGQVGSGGYVNDCGSSGESRAQDEWNFIVNQDTPFTMTATFFNLVDAAPVQVSAAYLLTSSGGNIQLTVGSLDAQSGIFRNREGSVTVTDSFAGTLLQGAYTIRLSARAASQGPATHGGYNQTLTLNLGSPCATADFNHDGDSGTDQDIEAFFACLAGSCCPTCSTADFNADGDTGTDADIEAFFRVLGGGNC